MHISLFPINSLGVLQELNSCFDSHTSISLSHQQSLHLLKESDNHNFLIGLSFSAFEQKVLFEEHLGCKFYSLIQFFNAVFLK